MFENAFFKFWQNFPIKNKELKITELGWYLLRVGAKNIVIW